jgi:hypothetical protein
MSLMDKIPASWQAGFVLLARPVLSRIGIEVDMARVYRELGVGNTSAYESARMLMKKMSTPPSSLSVERKKNRELDRNLRLTKFHIDLLRYHADNPRAWTQSEERHHCSDEFKALLLTKKSEYALEWSEISQVLGIPEETLKKFKHQVEEKDPGDGPPRVDLPESIVDQLRSFFQGRSSKVTAKSFADKHPEVLDELKMTYAQFANLLLKLGFTSPKGIFLNNTGLDKIERFAPHAVWGTDGKQMKVIINGEIFRFIWQCLIDYKSTVLVGGLVGESETTDNLLEAIRQSKKATGVAPMGIVIDGRLSENLPAIREYLDEMGIEIVRTYPGNPKSNGITEGNFGIFEKWIGGEVIINGETAKELSFSFAKVLTEVFTQLRNNQPRRGLGQKTANEVLASVPKLSPEEESTIRSKIQALANRFKNEQAVPVISEHKAQAIEQAIAAVLPPDPETFRKRLAPSMLTYDLILAAIAIFKKQQAKHPEKTFTHTYFGGILRNLVDQRSVEMLYTQLDQVYADHWARMANGVNQSGIATETPEQICQRLSHEFLDAKIPAHGWITLVHLQTVFMVAARGCALGAASLRDRLAEMIKKAKMACPEKRQRLLQKLFECEAVVKQITMSKQRTFAAEASPLL